MNFISSSIRMVRSKLSSLMTDGRASTVLDSDGADKPHG